MTATMRYDVRHETTYTYDADVVHAHQLLHLTPRNCDFQFCATHDVELHPLPGFRRDVVDAFGNPVTRFEVDRPHRRLDVVATMQVEVSARPDVKAGESLPWERVRDELAYASRPRAPRELEAQRFRMESPYVRVKNVFADFSSDCFARGRPILACAEALMHKIHEELAYAPGETHIGTTLLEVLETQRGVCQDFSHLMIACLRSYGLAARYVSGYLRTVPPEGQPALTGADASHAWVSVYAPPFGWVDLDPTNDVRVGTDHITLAWGRDFGDVSPLRGVIVGGGQHDLDVRVTVTARDSDSTAPGAPAGEGRTPVV